MERVPLRGSGLIILSALHVHLARKRPGPTSRTGILIESVCCTCTCVTSRFKVRVLEPDDYTDSWFNTRESTDMFGFTKPGPEKVNRFFQDLEASQRQHRETIAVEFGQPASSNNVVLVLLSRKSSLEYDKYGVGGLGRRAKKKRVCAPTVTLNRSFRLNNRWMDELDSISRKRPEILQRKR